MLGRQPQRLTRLQIKIEEDIGPHPVDAVLGAERIGEPRYPR